MVKLQETVAAFMRFLYVERASQPNVICLLVTCFICLVALSGDFITFIKFSPSEFSALSECNLKCNFVLPFTLTDSQMICSSRRSHTIGSFHHLHVLCFSLEVMLTSCGMFWVAYSLS